MLRVFALFLAGAHLVAVAAFRTDNVFVPAHQCRGHRASRNDESLGLECAKQKRQHKRDDNRFNGLADCMRLNGRRRRGFQGRFSRGISGRLRFGHRVAVNLGRMRQGDS